MFNKRYTLIQSKYSGYYKILIFNVNKIEDFYYYSHIIFETYQSHDELILNSYKAKFNSSSKEYLEQHFFILLEVDLFEELYDKFFSNLIFE